MGTVKRSWGVVVAAMLLLSTPVAAQPSAPSAARATTVGSPVATVCLRDLEPGTLNTLFDMEPAGIIGADYQRALAMPDGRVLWTFQDAAVRVADGDIRIVHNIAMVQDGSCFGILYRGGRSDPSSYFFPDRTTRFRHWFWPLDSTVGDDGRIYVYAAEMEERGDAYLTQTVPVGTWVAVFDPAVDAVVEEQRPPDSSADLYGWSITSDDSWTYLYAQCFRQFGFDEYAYVAAFDRSCSTVVTVARVPRGKLFDPMRYWDGRSWQADPSRARPIIETDGRRINANQFEWTGERFVSVNKEGDWWGDTIYLSASMSATGPFEIYDEIAAPVKCADCNSFFATWVPGIATRRTDDTFVIGLAHNRWDGVVSAVYRPTFHRVVAPTHLPKGRTLEVDVAPGTTAAAINVAVVGPHEPGFITVYPCAAGRPLASNVNHVGEPVVSNLVLARPDDDGRVCLYTLAESNLVVDLNGSFGSTETFRPAASPVRLADTRVVSVPGQRLPAGGVLPVTVPGGADDDVAAVAVNVVAVDPAAAGYLTVFPCDRERPATSNVNYVSEPVVSNLVVVPTSTDGRICVFSLAATDVVVDFAGTFTTDGYAALPDAVRLVDTRERPDGRVPAGGRVEVTVPPGAAAAVLGVIAAEPAGPGFLTVYPCDEPVPTASNVNHVNVAFVSNLVVARPSSDGRVCVFSSAETDIVVDLAGVLSEESDFEPLPVPTRVVDTRIGVGVAGQFGVR